jgi:5'-3' exonuclease
VAHGETCHALRGEGNEIDMVPIPSLRCDHEEADTRMLLHTHYAASHSAVVVIKSIDTDVFIISLGMSKQFSSRLLFHTGTGTKVLTIDLQAIRSQIGDDITHALIGLHAITGCDSVSGFYGKGKVKAAKLLFKEQAYQQSLGELGMQHEVSEDLCAKLDSFVCHLYGQSACADVNDARFVFV